MFAKLLDQRYQATPSSETPGIGTNPGSAFTRPIRARAACGKSASDIPRGRESLRAVVPEVLVCNQVEAGLQACAAGLEASPRAAPALHRRGQGGLRASPARPCCRS